MEYLTHNANLNGDDFCAIALGKGCGNWEEINSWTISVPGGKPSVIEPTLPDPALPKTKVLQVCLRLKQTSLLMLILDNFRSLTSTLT